MKRELLINPNGGGGVKLPYNKSVSALTKGGAKW